jgi:hypothetical protein
VVVEDPDFGDELGESEDFDPDESAEPDPALSDDDPALSDDAAAFVSDFSALSDFSDFLAEVRLSVL